MHFKSDHTAPAHPLILEALQKASFGHESSYSHDSWTKKATAQFCHLFEREVAVFFVTTGTAANCLALQAICPSFGGIYCTPEAHIENEECGAIHFFQPGAKLHIVESQNGKMKPEALKRKIAQMIRMAPHYNRPAALSLTQATEVGTVYTCQEMSNLAAVAREHKIALHVDGARFANAVAHLNCSLAEASWKCGIDTLSFGFTKNGALLAEAVVFFNLSLAEQFSYRLKQAGHLPSKQRYLAAQFITLLEDDLWLKNGLHANLQAQKLAKIAKSCAVEVAYPVQANEVFLKMPLSLAEKLQELGVGFYRWGELNANLYRFVTSWYTTDREMEAFHSALSHLALNGQTLAQDNSMLTALF